MNRFTIFIKSNKTIWTNNRVIYTILVSCFSILFFEKYFLQIEKSFSDNFFGGIIVFTLISGIILKIIGLTKTEPLKGKLEGSIIFEKNSIIANGDVFNLEKIKNIEISNDDYYGKIVNVSRGNFNGALSNGVNNLIKIKLYSGENKFYNYQLYNSNDFQKIRNELIIYYLNGKIEFENLSNILGEKSKQEIKELKLEIEEIATTTNRA